MGKDFNYKLIAEKLLGAEELMLMSLLYLKLS
jgi:hypothetical protein